MPTITRAALPAILNGLDRGTPACIFTRTEPKMRKTGNPFIGNCVRLARRNVFLGVDYESCANRALARADAPTDFVAGPLPWGEHAGRYFIAHKGVDYLKFYPVPGVLEDRWETLAGQPIDFDEVRPFLFGSRDIPVPWRTVRLDNLVQINVAKEAYTLTD